MGLTVHRIRGDRPRVKIPWWMGLTQEGSGYRRYDMIPFCWIYRFFRQLGREMTNFFELYVDIPYWEGLSIYEAEEGVDRDDAQSPPAKTYIKGINLWRIHIRWRNEDLASLAAMRTPYLWVGFQYGEYDEMWSKWLFRKPIMVPRRAGGINPEFHRFSAKSRVDGGGNPRYINGARRGTRFPIQDAISRERAQLHINRREARTRYRENRRRRSGGRIDESYAVADTRATREIAEQDQRNVESAVMATENAEERMRDIDIPGEPVTEEAVDLALEDTRNRLQAIHDGASESAAGLVLDSIASVAMAGPAQEGDGPPTDRFPPSRRFERYLAQVGVTVGEWRGLSREDRRGVLENIRAIRATLPRTQEDPVKKVHRARLIQPDEDRSEQERDGTPSGSEEGD